MDGTARIGETSPGLNMLRSPADIDMDVDIDGGRDSLDDRHGADMRRQPTSASSIRKLSSVDSLVCQSNRLFASPTGSDPKPYDGSSMPGAGPKRSQVQVVSRV